MDEPQVGQGYIECIVTFFDILGFRQIVKTNSAARVSNILALFRHVSTNRDGVSRVAPPAGWPQTHIEVVSDAIVRVTDNGAVHLHGAQSLFEEILALKEVQIDCILQGVLLRGAVTLGKMHVGTNWQGPFFGPALIEAFDMETKEVVYPRIGIHEDVVRYCLTDPSSDWCSDRKIDEDMLNLLLSQDGSGLYYIDYLRATIDDRNNGPDEIQELCAAHKKIITEGLLHPYGKTRRKYSWLRNYHNSVLRSGIQKDSIDPFSEETLIERKKRWRKLMVE